MPHDLIMVIDDERTVLQALHILLEAWGFRVLAAESETDAVARIADAGEPPSLILADYRLREGRTGLEAIQRILDAAGHSIPSIILTGDTSTAALDEARARGVPVLQKPVLPPYLHSMVTQTLRQAWG